MNILLKIAEIYVPTFIKKVKLKELFDCTAAAFNSPVPPLKGLSFDKCLVTYAEFTKQEAETFYHDRFSYMNQVYDEVNSGRGWHIVPHPGHHKADTCVYSIGLYRNFNHPELILFGYELDRIGHILDHIKEKRNIMTTIWEEPGHSIPDMISLCSNACV